MVNRKIELSILIKNHLSNNRPIGPVSEGTERYMNAFLVIVKNENKQKLNEFLSAYQPLLKKKNIPFLSLNTLLSLYERWKIYPAIIKEIQYLNLRLKRMLLKEDFWCLFIRLSGTDGNKALQENRMTLLTCMMD